MKIVLFRITPETVRGFPVSVDMGLAYLYKALSRGGHETYLVDGVLEPESPESLVQRFGRQEPWVLAMKLFTHQIGPSRAFARRVKALDPKGVIAFGGAHPSTMGERIFDSVPEADYALAGEGEIGFPLLAAALEAPPSGDWEAAVPGLIYRKNGAVHQNEPKFVDDLDALGEPPWREVGLERYLPFTSAIRKAPLIPILTTRGCPYRCAYCSAYRLSGRTMRFRDPRMLVDEIEGLVRHFDIKAFSLLDDNFTVRASHAEAFCEALVKRGLNLQWDCLPIGIRLDTLTVDLLKKMERSGCIGMSVAVESANQTVLDAMRKDTSFEQIAEKIRLIKKHTRMTINTFNILGYPTEDRRTVLNTVRFARRCGADYAMFFLFTPLPGTEITETLVREGRLGEIRWETFQYDAPSVPLKDLSLGGLKRMQIWAYLSFYMRPRAILRTLRDAGMRDILQRFLSMIGIRRREGETDLSRRRQAV